MQISKETLSFLSKLKKNNNRDWFEKHKDEFKELYEQFGVFSEEIAKGVASFDDRVKKDLKHKKTVKLFRIYRDVRFSKDKSPYKVNFGLTVAPKGFESGAPGYYVHIQPGGKSFAGGGLHMPPSPRLKKLRTTISKKPNDLRKILNSASFKKVFVELGDYDMLKTVPRGFDKEDPAADLLKYKSFTASKNFSDSSVSKSSFSKEVIKTFKELKKLNDYLWKASR